MAKSRFSYYSGSGIGRSSRRSVSRTRIIVRESYYWPDWQLNFFIIIMLVTGGVLIGTNAAFVIQQQTFGFGIPWLLPFSITIGVLTVVFVTIMLILIYQRRLLPAVVMIGSFILFVLYITGLIDTALQLFGSSSNIYGACHRSVIGHAPPLSNAPTVDQFIYLQQDSICRSWEAALSFWIVGAVFLLYMIILGGQVARGNFGEPVIAD